MRYAGHNLENVLKLGVLTGSRAFNCSTTESDWDIVITESNLPPYRYSTYYRETIFNMDNLAGYIPKGFSKPVFDLEEQPDLGEDYLEYDQNTIWGPLQSIVKYLDDEGNWINLFIYSDNHKPILEKFKELNNLMNFVHGFRLKDKDYRIQAFIEIINKVGITNYS